MVASIEYIEQIIATFQAAAQANIATPGREGNTILLEPNLAAEVMVTGDLHGHRQNFHAIRKVAALDQNPRRHLVLQEVCHGGGSYPNGGCMSHLILEEVAKLKVQFPDRVHFILGNHELAEMTDYPIRKYKQLLNLVFRLGLQQMYGPATEKVRQAYCEFIQSSPLAVRLPGGAFISHSVPENVDRQQFDTSIFSRKIDRSEYFDRTGVFELVWGRDYRAENADAFARLVGANLLINGHEPCPDGYSTPNPTQVILDCCGQRACFVILTTDRTWTQAEVVERIQRLP